MSNVPVFVRNNRPTWLSQLLQCHFYLYFPYLQKIQAYNMALLSLCLGASIDLPPNKF
jgi:hypothetical protein